MEDFANLLQRDYGFKPQGKIRSKAKVPIRVTLTYDDELLPGLRSGYSRPSQQNERASFISVDGSSQSPAEVDPFAGIQPDPFSNISAMPSIPDPLDPFTGYPETKSANGIGDGIDGFDIFSQPSAKTSSNKKSSHPSKDRIYDTGIRETPEAKPVRRNYAAAPKQPEADIGREPALNDSSPKKKEQVHLDEDFSPAGDLNSEEFTEPPFHDMKESWITIDDVRLITDPTTALPPSRPAPGFTSDSETLNKESDHDKPSNVFDELEEFAAPGEFAPQEEEARTFSSSAAAMNEAIERTEAKLKRTREKEKARNEDKEEHEQRDEKEREEREKERQRRERDKERERDRAAVERATQEARDRAAIEARERAERAAVERATAEARERAAAEAKQRAAEKTAVERAAKEARQRAERAAVERANAEARERAERAAAERAATGRVTAEARERAAERAAVGRASAEARERAAAAAAAAAAREQQRGSDDLDNLFGARANSAPKQRPPTADFMTDTRPPKGYSGDRRSSTGAPVKKVSSVSGIDELTGLFGNSASSDFQEVEGETPDRRKARLERDRRTLERAQKALADKHQRDLNAQREQAEKHRVGEALDAEIRRWAAGKEGNLRALLSTLQYVLWPECGWQPVSLTDLITGASVKKVYRKATLCVHPDKVQQKGATVQQKYIAEKVFDMLKEAWNKLNAEELF